MAIKTTEADLRIRHWEYASQYLPGGVSASARLNKALGGPFYASRGEGAYVYDLEGRRYVDMHNSFGAALLGHGHPAIRRAVAEAAELGIICAHETIHQAGGGPPLRRHGALQRLRHGDNLLRHQASP